MTHLVNVAAEFYFTPPRYPALTARVTSAQLRDNS